MATDRYDNDPAIKVTADGGDLDYIGGQPLMDQGGLENAVIISLFTREGWVGNALETDPNRMVGSDFYKGQGQPITSATIRAMEKSAERALKWMVNIGLAHSVKATASAVTPKRVKIHITIIQIDTTSLDYEYDLNWTASRQQESINIEPTIEVINPPPVPADRDIYLDGNSTGTGDGSIDTPFGQFDELDWVLIASRVAIGDSINIRLKRGTVWTGADAELVIGASGGETNPITIEPYDVGVKPTLDLPTPAGGIAVHALDKEYIILDGVHVEDAGTGITPFRFDGLSKNNTIRNCWADNSYDTHGFYMVGDALNPSTGNKFYNNYSSDNGLAYTYPQAGAFFSYVEDSRVYENEMNDNQGNSLTFSNSHNNIIEDNLSNICGNGGIYFNLSSGNIHRRNYQFRCSSRGGNQGFINCANFSDNNISYMNVFETNADYGYLARDTSLGNLFYNNTMVGYGDPAVRIYNSAINNVFKNNLYWTDSATEIVQCTQIPQVFDYNIYYNTLYPTGINRFSYGGGWLDWVAEWNPANDPNGDYADPLFARFVQFDFPNNELWVTAGSPAIGAAVDLGAPEYDLRLDQTSKWIKFDETTGEIIQASDVKTVIDPTTIGAFEYIAP